MIEKGVTYIMKKSTSGSVQGPRWYVDAGTHRSGPFASREEAARFSALLDAVSAAGVACSWITRDGGRGVARMPGARLAKKPD